MNASNTNKFPTEVINELKYYVYRLVDPRNDETFYIGKGKGNRVFNHLECALVSNEYEDEIELKYKKIRDITSEGYDVTHIIHRHGLDEETAYHVEAALLDLLDITTNIQGGRYSNDIGPMNVSDILVKYKAETAKFAHRIVLININRTINDRSIYDAVRFAWRLDVERVKNAEYVLAVEKGIIVGVFKPTSWHLARKQYFPDFEKHTNKRYGFIGEEAEMNIQERYMYKRIPSIYRKKGASNPIKYTYKGL